MPICRKAMWPAGFPPAGMSQPRSKLEQSRADRLDRLWRRQRRAARLEQEEHSAAVAVCSPARLKKRSKKPEMEEFMVSLPTAEEFMGWKWGKMRRSVALMNLEIDALMNLTARTEAVGP